MPRAIFEDIVIQNFDQITAIASCQYTPIRFFEILLFEEGNGWLKINDQTVAYHKHQIFTLIPDDKYNLEIEKPTTVTAIKFLNSFFTNFSLYDQNSQQKEWFKKIENILHSANRTSSLNIKSETDTDSMLALFKVLRNEYNDKSLNSEVILKTTLHAILHIVSRNVNATSSKTASSKIQDIINFIHLHIDDPSKLSAKSLADEFSISETYISQYFKKQMGMSIKKYILNHRVKLAETRLKYTDLTVSEIASELGFTDSSHLDKTLFSYTGVTAGLLRSPKM
ncbi:helix-turn-helix domain-containing protein [Reichenbachiella versicolor]|uniref:helix-turn-helix domain-containing protein n=1 Tax=Reichenbachiella versicolor TaxID=1821036 RepID=UPI000D6DDD7D|nr:AraC family transcriptional regulator [Reichenbachiella versicolor]